MALFGFVLDEYDVPHDNPQGLIVLGSGALAGLIAGVVLGVRPAARTT
jgi:F0F1-type ATP synthase assembly protein I